VDERASGAAPPRGGQGPPLCLGAAQIQSQGGGAARFQSAGARAEAPQGEERGGEGAHASGVGGED